MMNLFLKQAKLQNKGSFKSCSSIFKNIFRFNNLNIPIRNFSTYSQCNGSNFINNHNELITNDLLYFGGKRKTINVESLAESMIKYIN